MRRSTPLFLLIAFLFGLFLWPLKAFAAGPELVSPSPGARPVVDIIKIDGIIDRPMADYILGSLDDAEAAGHAVVLQVNTRGTSGVDAMDLARRVAVMKVPVVVWVGPPGSHAGGAGAMLAYAAGLTSVSPGSGIGPLAPTDLNTGADPTAADLQQLAGWGSDVPQQGRGDPGRLLHTEMTAQQAIDSHVADPVFTENEITPQNLIDFLDRASGRTVSTADGTVILNTRVSASPAEGPGVTIVYHDLGPWRRVLHAVSSPTAVYVLLVLAFAGFAFELTQPGFGFAGISGLVALGLASYGLWNVPPNWIGLALLIAGFGLLTVDVQLRKLGALTALGMIGFAAGSFLLYPDVAAVIRIPGWVILVALAGGFWFFAFGLTIAQQAYQRIHSTQVGLVGLTGETRGELNPEGAVHVKGTLWRGRTVGEPIPAGMKVRVRAVDGLILRVEPEPEED